MHKTVAAPALALSLASALMLFPAAALAADGFSLEAGIQQSSGSYGDTQSTEILYIPLTASYQRGDWVASLTVPYIRVTGPGGVLQGFGRVAPPGGGGTITSGPRLGRTTTGGTTTNSGLGDIIAALGRTVIGGGEDDLFDLDLVGKIKFGTANANAGLGTGENDYSLQADGKYWLTDETSLLGTMGYKIVGKPAGLALNNVAFGSLGMEHATSDETTVGFDYDYVQKIAYYGYAQRYATLTVSHDLAPDLSVAGYVLKGFSDGSPDHGIGASITGSF